MRAVDEIFSLFLTMSSSRLRRRRCSNLSFILIILVFYLAVQCDTSHIFDFFKRSQPSSLQSPSYHHHHVSSGSSPGSSGPVGRSEEDSGHVSHHGDEQTTSYEGTPQHHHSVARGHSHGWGYGGGHGGDSNLDLYSLLGGLSFASLLGATIVFLARRSSTTTMVMNTTGRRRRRDLNDMLEDEEDELLGKPLPEFMDKFVNHLNHPWWWKEKETVDKNNVVPFKLK